MPYHQQSTIHTSLDISNTISNIVFIVSTKPVSVTSSSSSVQNQYQQHHLHITVFQYNHLKSLKYGMLSLSDVDRTKLVDPDIMIAKYKHYHESDKTSDLAQKLSTAQKSWRSCIGQMYCIGNRSLPCSADLSIK